MSSSEDKGRVEGTPRRRWARNARFWIQITQEQLDPYRTQLTDVAVLRAGEHWNGKAVLDAGCGEGYLARELAQRGAQVVGVDLSKELIIAAVRKSQEDDLPISFFIGDIMTLGLRDATFDIILSNHGLNELPDLDSAFREFARVLRPNGSLIALMLHPCFYSSRSSGRLESPTTYFDERRIERHFEVSGLTSPSPALRILRPLEHYASSLRKAGFMIEDLQEPHPPIEVLEKDPWWRANFPTPLFLLLKARKCQ